MDYATILGYYNDSIQQKLKIKHIIWRFEMYQVVSNWRLNPLFEGLKCIKLSVIKD